MIVDFPVLTGESIRTNAPPPATPTSTLGKFGWWNFAF